MFINCHSHYSLRYGIVSESELLKIARKYQVSTVALTDVNNTSGCLNFVRLAQKLDIKPILGIDFRRGAQQLFLGLAEDNEGFHELNDFLSWHSHTDTPLPDVAPDFGHVKIIYPMEQMRLLSKTTLKDNEYIGIHRSELSKLRFSRYSDQEGRLVALNAFTFRNKKDHNTHRLLRAIDCNTLLSKLDPSQQASDHDLFLPPEQLQEFYAERPEILVNTERLLDGCSIFFDFSPSRSHQNKLRYTDSREEDESLLHRLCEEGLRHRYDDITPALRQRLDKELDMIQRLDFVPFFLVNWDIICYAKSKGYFHVGRGSGANSVVAYILGITDVDPIELDLYFERFMNLYRSSPPDFDIDFSWRDRQDVTRYIFERFGGRGQVALLATYNTFQHRAAVRELGKVFGLPKEEIDKLSRGVFDFKSLDRLSQLVLIYAKVIEGMPNYLSIHAGGILISERPIHYFSATDLPPKGFPTTQFDMVVAEDVGLYKYDILGQRGLAKIKDALALVKANRSEGDVLDIHDVRPLLRDAQINAKIAQGQCIGCFYVESPAMRMLLRKLEVDNYPALVAASSIIRPGVAKSGMMREYILRHKDPDRRQQAHPVLQAIMPETYGVMVYQEDVIKVAHHFAGLHLAEADVLRRGMSGKYRSREEFAAIQKKFMDSCEAKGYDTQTIQEVWRQIESFAGYAFAKGHSASYAVESYQSLYLKTYFPLEYMVAVLNNGGGFYSRELYVHEARRHGGVVHPPCINRSLGAVCIEGKEIFLGFQFLQGMDGAVARRIVRVREDEGGFQSLEDFIHRVPISLDQLEILIRIGAFRTVQPDKRAALWKAHYIYRHRKQCGAQRQLFEPEYDCDEVPDLDRFELEDVFDQIELLGFPLCSPFCLLSEPLGDGLLRAAELVHRVGQCIEIIGYAITFKNTTTSSQKRMQFGTFLDLDGDWVDTVHFPPVVRQFPARGKGVYRIQGKVVEEFGFYSVEVSGLWRLPYRVDSRYQVAR